MDVLAPDPRPGNYYVSVINGAQRALLAGPFRSHTQALAAVEPARERAHSLDLWSTFYSFGTVRMADNYTKPGLFNRMDLREN